VRRPNPTRCPQCREHVSPYAAGCALCGADLDPDRTRHVPLSRRIGSAWDAFSVRTELIVLAIVIVLLVSYFGAGRL
jgi:predicted amidophosphoribosyltransferase